MRGRAERCRSRRACICLARGVVERLVRPISRARSVALVSVASVILVGVGHAQNTTSQVRQSRIEGTWFPTHATESMRTANGSVPPLTPEARALYEERVDARAAGSTAFDRATWCASPGAPRIMFMPYPLEIVIDKRRIAILSGWYRRYRVIDMSGTKLEVVFPTSMGVSTGRWDGDRLLVETIGLLPETTLDAWGLPHSADMKLTERFEAKDADTLEIRFTVDDPANYVRPWDAVMTYRRLPDQHVLDDVCLDRIKRGEPAVKPEPR